MDVHAVDDLSFEIKKGETLAFVGESGSGKTMSVLAVLGLTPRHAVVTGDIAFDGLSTTTMSPAELRRIRAERVGFVFQNPIAALNPVRTIGSQLTEVLRVNKRLSRREARAVGLELLGKVGLPTPVRQFGMYPHQLSGGMCQRVGIAIAIACEPRLLIADEPTTALDVSIQAQILDLLASLRAQLHTSVLFISHDLAVVAGIADRVAVMYAGRLVEEGPTQAILEAPSHPYTQTLMQHLVSEVAPPAKSPVSKAVQSGPLGGCVFSPKCPFVHERCLLESPPLQTVAPNHAAACFLADGLASASEVSDEAREVTWRS